MDKSSQTRIATLHPSVRAEVTTIVNECNSNLTGRSQMRIAQALRTFAEQDALYAQGRTGRAVRLPMQRVVSLFIIMVLL